MSLHDSTMKPIYMYYFTLDVAMELVSCKAKLIFVKSNIY